MGLLSSNPSQTCLSPFFSNVITPLVTLPGMAPWANQWLNISVRISINLCGSLKFTSLGKLSSPGDLLRPTCFNASRTSHSACSRPNAEDVGTIAAKLLKQEICDNKLCTFLLMLKIHPKSAIVQLSLRVFFSPFTHSKQYSNIVSLSGC